MYPTRGGTPNVTGYRPHMGMSNQMAQGMNAYNRNPAGSGINPMQYQHGGMAMMMPMGTNYQWPMMVPRHMMQQQMYNTQVQMPMYSSGVTSTSYSYNAAQSAQQQTTPVTTASSGNTMRLPTVICPVEEDSTRRNVQPAPAKQPAAPRRASNTTVSSSSSYHQQGLGSINTGPATVSSCKSTFSSDPCYVPLQQALSMIGANKQPARIVLSAPQTNKGVGQRPVLPLTLGSNMPTNGKVLRIVNGSKSTLLIPLGSSLSSNTKLPVKIVSSPSNTSLPVKIVTSPSNTRLPVTIVTSSPHKPVRLEIIPSIAPSNPSNDPLPLKVVDVRSVAVSTSTPANTTNSDIVSTCTHATTTQTTFTTTTITSTTQTSMPVSLTFTSHQASSVSLTPTNSVALTSPTNVSTSECDINDLQGNVSLKLSHSNASTLVNNIKTHYVSNVEPIMLNVIGSEHQKSNNVKVYKLTKSCLKLKPPSQLNASTHAPRLVPTNVTPSTSTKCNNLYKMCGATPPSSSSLVSEVSLPEVFPSSAETSLPKPWHQRKRSVKKKLLKKLKKSLKSPKKFQKSPKPSPYSLSFAAGRDYQVYDDLVLKGPQQNMKYQYQSEEILMACANVDIPLFLTKIQGYGRRTYKCLCKILPDVFFEMQKDFIFLEEEQRYSCIRCYFVSPRVEKALEHILAHYGPMICEICNKAFIKKCDEDRHMNAHRLGRVKCRVPRYLPTDMKGQGSSYLKRFDSIRYQSTVPNRVKSEPESEDSQDAGAKENQFQNYLNTQEHVIRSIQAIQHHSDITEDAGDNDSDARSTTGDQSVADDQSTVRDQITANDDSSIQSTARDQITANDDSSNQSTARDQITANDDSSNQSTAGDQITAYDDSSNQSTAGDQITANDDSNNQSIAGDQITANDDSNNQSIAGHQITADDSNQTSTGDQITVGNSSNNQSTVRDSNNPSTVGDSNNTSTITDSNNPGTVRDSNNNCTASSILPAPDSDHASPGTYYVIRRMPEGYSSQTESAPQTVTETSNERAVYKEQDGVLVIGEDVNEEPVDSNDDGQEITQGTDNESELRSANASEIIVTSRMNVFTCGAGLSSRVSLPTLSVSSTSVASPSSLAVRPTTSGESTNERQNCSLNAGLPGQTGLGNNGVEALQTQVQHNEMPRVLEIAPIQSDVPTMQSNSVSHQAALRNITNIEQQQSLENSNVPQTENHLVISEVTGAFPRTEIHDSARVLVISPCLSPTRVKKEPVDNYWYNNSINNAASNLHNVSTWSSSRPNSTVSNTVTAHPPLANNHTAPPRTTARLPLILPRQPPPSVLPRPPPDIPPPPPLVSTPPVVTNHRPRPVIQAGSQVVPVTLIVPNLLPEAAPLSLPARTPFAIVSTTPSAVTTTSSSRRHSQNSIPSPVVRHSSTETMVMQTSPMISAILTNAPSFTSSTPSLCTTSTLNTATGLTSQLQRSQSMNEGSVATNVSSSVTDALTATQSATVPSTTGTPASSSTGLLNIGSIVNPVAPCLSSNQESMMTVATPHVGVVSPGNSATHETPSLAPRKRPHYIPDMLACQLCSYVAKTHFTLEKHYDAHSKNIECRYCNKAFVHMWMVKDHEKKHITAGDIPRFANGLSITTCATNSSQKTGPSSLNSSCSLTSMSNVSMAGTTGTVATPCTLQSSTTPVEFHASSALTSLANLVQTSPSKPGDESTSVPKQALTSGADSDCIINNNSSSNNQEKGTGGISSAEEKLPSNSQQLTNLPFRLDNFSNSILTETNLFQCDIKDNNEIVLTLMPFKVTEATSLDTIKDCPPVSSLTDISEIMEGVKKAKDPVDVKVIEIVMPSKSKKRKKSAQKGSSSKKSKTLDGSSKKKKKKKSQGGGQTSLEGYINYANKSCTDPLPNLDLPGNYVADPVHYDTLSPNRSQGEAIVTAGTPRKVANSADGPISSNGETASASTMNSGAVTTDTEKKYKCTICPYTADARMKLKAHEKAHEMKLQMCDFCYKAFFKMDDLVRHVESVHRGAQQHGGGDNSETDEVSSGRAYSCDCCEYQTDLYARFKLHQNMHRTGQNICQWCGRAFLSTEKLVIHWFTHNRKDSENMYNCNLCPYKIKEKQLMTTHMTHHYREKPSSSNLSSPDSSSKSKRSKPKEGAFYCPDCAAVFALPSLLAWHRRKVHNVVTLSTYKCQSCDVSYTSQMKLKRHVAESHKQTEPAVSEPAVNATSKGAHQCQVCSRRFSTAGHLKMHAVGHAEKSYKCKGCSKGFSFPHHLRTHLKKCRKSKVPVKKLAEKPKNDIKLGDVMRLNTLDPPSVKSANSQPPKPAESQPPKLTESEPLQPTESPPPPVCKVDDDDDDVMTLNTLDTTNIKPAELDQPNQSIDDDLDDDDVIFIDIESPPH